MWAGPAGGLGSEPVNYKADTSLAGKSWVNWEIHFYLSHCSIMCKEKIMSCHSGQFASRRGYLTWLSVPTTAVRCAKQMTGKITSEKGSQKRRVSGGDCDKSRSSQQSLPILWKIFTVKGRHNDRCVDYCTRNETS
ncbi:hypothetical protein J6590_033685 [Homalodisca vitripennis]|nr:hypothetical protein J6590_033685 [Homalodisca vitripennis]